MKEVKIIFFGSGSYGNIALKRMLQNNLRPILVVTKPDRPKGRGQKIQENEVVKTAKNFGIKILKPEKLDQIFIEKIKEEKPNIGLVVSYGKILPKKLLEIPSFGFLNIHPSLLPKYRGPSPLEAPFLNDEEITGVSIIILDEEMDHGPILIQDQFEIHKDMTKKDLGVILFEHGIDLFIENFEDILNGKITAEEQNHNLATFTSKIKKEEGLLDIKNDIEAWKKYRAYLDYPGVFFFNQNNKRIKITKAKFENGKFIIQKIIPENEKEKDFQN